MNEFELNPKEELLLKIAEDFLDHFDEKTAQTALALVDKNMYNYDISTKETSLAIRDTFTERVLKIYIGAKRLEGRSDKTLKLYYNYINKLLDFLQCSINEVTTNGIRLYLSNAKIERELQNSTIENMRSAINAVFQWLVANQYLQFNPAAAIAPIKIEEKIKMSFSTEEMAAIRAACKDIRQRTIVEFFYSTGCRVSEVISVNIEDLDLIHNELIVTGKGNKQRKVYINSILKEYLVKYLDRTEGPLFVTASGPNKGKRTTKSGMEYILKSVGKRANVTNVHPHRFRRTLATDLLNNGMSIQDVSKLLGHSSIAITQRYYYHVDEQVKNAFNTFVKNE